MNTASINRAVNRAVDEWRVAVIGVAVLIVLTAAAYFVEVAPILQDRDNYRQSAVDLANKKQELASKQNAIRVAEQQIKMLTDRKASELALSPQQQINDRLSMLSSLATDRGLILESTEPGNTLTQPRYSTIAIRISGHGKFPQCVTFLQQLRKTLPDVSVNDLAMTGGADASNVNFSMNLVWFAAPGSAVAKTDAN